MNTERQPGTPPIDPFTPIRPRGVRWVAYVLAVIVVVSLIALFAYVRPNAATKLGIEDYVLMVVFAGGLLGVLWRQATVVATPDEKGLLVRNLLSTRYVTWPEVVSVRFSSDRAWAQLDLSDGDHLAVMAIQSSDGAMARQGAVRLASLAQRFSEAGS